MTHTHLNQEDLFFAELDSSVVHINGDQLNQIKELIDTRGTAKEIKSFRKISGVHNQGRMIHELAAELSLNAKVLSALVPEDSKDDREKSLQHFELISHIIHSSIIERSKLVLDDLCCLLEYETETDS